MSEFDDQVLARRIASIDVPFDTEALTRRVLASASPGRSARGRVWRFVLLVPLALALVSAATAYYAPVFAEGLADAPVAGSVAGWLLRQVGLTGSSHRISVFGESATSSGHTIELVGGYADAGRTVLFVRIDPPALGFSPFAPVEVSDQFGRTYRASGAAWNSETGDGVLTLAPIEGLAARVGARLRIVFTEIREAPPAERRIAGKWELTATLAVDEGRPVALPDPIALGSARVRFTEVRALASALLVEFDVENASPADLARTVPDGLKGRPAFRIRLFAPGGDELHSLQGGGSGSHQSWLWPIETGGRYELNAEWEGVGGGSRVIDVP